MGLPKFSYEKASSDEDSSEDGRFLLTQEEREKAFRNVSIARGFKMIGSSPKLIFVMVIPFLTLVMTIIFGGVLLRRTWKPTLSQISISTRIPPDFCGTTPAQAKAAGCKFEANNFAWLHPACHDEEMEEEWRYGPWSSDLQFWRERDDHLNGVGVVSKEEAFSGEVSHVYVNTLQHRWHCLHNWMKYVKFANEKKPMDSWTISPQHVRHCVILLRDFNHSWPDQRISSVLNLKFPACEYGPVGLTLTKNGWTEEQKKNHYPGFVPPNEWTAEKLKALFPDD